MKNFTMIVAITVFSINLFAEELYRGVNPKGEKCIFRLDLDDESAGMGDCYFTARKPIKKNENRLIIYGGADFLDCKIKVKLNEAGEPEKATLSTRHILKPIFTRVHTCKDLVRVK